MDQERKHAVISVLLYSLCSLIVGCAVGGTLLLKVTTQDNAPSAVTSPTGQASADEITTTTTTAAAVTETAPPPPDADMLHAIVSRAETMYAVDFSYTDSDRFELYSEVFGRRVPFTSSAVILTYSGTVTVEVPADALTFSVDAAAKHITVSLPEPKVTAHTIDTDSVRCYNLENALFGENDTAAFVTELIKRKNDVLARVLNDQDCYRRAAEHAQKLTQSLLAVAEETKGYAVLFDVPELPAVTTAAPAATAPAETTTQPQTLLPHTDDDDNLPLWW